MNHTGSLLSDSDVSWIASRWQLYIPLVRLESLVHYPTDVALLIHRNRVIECLRLGLPRETIARYSLDDPRTSDDDYRHTLAVALERRRARMGRKRGQKRDPYVPNRT